MISSCCCVTPGSVHKPSAACITPHKRTRSDAGDGGCGLSDAAGSEAVAVDGALLAHDLDELIVLGVAFEVGRALLHEASDALLRSQPRETCSEMASEATGRGNVGMGRGCGLSTHHEVWQLRRF